MIKKSTYLHFIRLSVFLALLGLSLDNIISYTYSDFAHMNFELFDHIDTDGEEETEKDKEQEEKDEKVQVNNFAINTPSSNNLINLMLANQLYSIPHREIQIPPPKKA